MRILIMPVILVLCFSFAFGIPSYAHAAKKPVSKLKTSQTKQLKKPMAKRKTQAAPPAKKTVQPVKQKTTEKDSTATKAKDLLEKLNALKKIEPVRVIPLKPIGRQKPQDAKTIFDQPTQDAPVRDYYRDHPGSYGPPLLKYDLPTGL